MIKTTKVPVICICNDRQSLKIRSLVNHCFDLRFQRPKVDQIKGAMMSVCFKEGITIEPQALREMIIASGQDVRQVLHNLSLWSALSKKMNTEEVQKAAVNAKKNSKMVRFPFSSTFISCLPIPSPLPSYLSPSLTPLTYTHTHPYTHDLDKIFRVHLTSYELCSVQWRERENSRSMRNRIFSSTITP